MRSIREWYELSRGGTRKRFLDELDNLSPDALVSQLRTELKQPPVQSLRTLEDLRGYSRVALPDLAELKRRPPDEQTLQYFFMHRGYFRLPSEVVLDREYPTSDRKQRRPAVVDLLIFDSQQNVPLIVELKQARAYDPLFGVVLESLHHWIFLTRNRSQLRQVFQQEGYCFTDSAPVRLAIAAPEDYFKQTKRRSDGDPDRNREYDRALDALQALAARADLVIPLVAIQDEWMENGCAFSTDVWWQPAPPVRADLGCFYGSYRPQSLATIIYEMCDGEFLNLTRSTVPSLHFWRKPESALKEVLQGIGSFDSSDGKLCFEFPVESIPGNKPSFSDLAYITGNLSVIIEAKSTEPVGESVEQWFEKKGRSANAMRVLRHWLSLIEPITGGVDETQIREVPYQMIHRAASLCSLETPRRVLLYQQHRMDAEAVDFRVPLEKLAAAINAAGRIGIWLHTIDLQRTQRYREVEQMLRGAKGNEAPLRVRSAIMEGKLFRIEGQCFRRIC